MDKIKSLLVHCGAENLGIDEDCTYEDLKERMETPIDHNSIDIALEQLRKKSKDKLIEGIERVLYE